MPAGAPDPVPIFRHVRQRTMSSKILITGASGFIGNAVTAALARAGYRVRAASRQPGTAAGLPDVEWVRLPDLTSEFEWAPLLEGVDIVIHLAGIAHRGGKETSGYDKVNRAATARLARACVGRGIKRLIFMSSIGAQAGSAADTVVTENQEPMPATAYDRSKLAAEEEVRGAGVPFTILRPVLVYGPGAKANIALMVRLASLPVPLPFGALKTRRSLLSIDNLTSALIFCIETPATVDRTFIVSDPRPIGLSDMIATLRDAAGRTPLLFPFPPAVLKALLLALGKRPLWDRLGRDLVASSAELQALGWVPPVETEEGLRQMMQASVR